MKRMLAVVVVSAAIAGCHSPTNATTMARPIDAGVHVSLVGQSCRYGDDMQDLVVQVRIDNPTGSTLHVDEDLVRLKIGELSAAVREPHTLDVPAHSDVTIPIVFRHHAVCEPEQRFAVNWNDALVVD